MRTTQKTWPRRLLNDRRGFTAVVLALLALPLIGVVGIGVDYGLSIRAESLLNSAADAAALAATDAASNAVINNQTNYSQQGVAAGTQAFNAVVATIPNVTVQPVSITVNENPPGSTTFVTVVSYTASYSTFFGRLFQTNSFPLSGGSTAQITLKAFEDFHILMDTSGSMAIGATESDMSTLASLTLAASQAAYQNIAPYNLTYNGINSYMGQGSKNCSQTTNGHTTYTCGAAQSNTQGCAFACHWDTGNTCSSTAGCDFYAVAKGANANHTVVTLRQDLEQQAVQQVITALSSQDTISQYRAAVYGFSTAYAAAGTGSATISSNLQVVSALPAIGAGSSALLTAAAAAGNMVQPVAGTDHSPAPPGSLSVPEPNTNFGAAMTALAAGMSCPGSSGTYIPCPGDGATSTAPQEFLFIITDGLEDFCPGSTGATVTVGCSGRTIQPIQASECAALKAQGVQILVLYVQYYPLDQNPYYNGFYVNDGLGTVNGVQGVQGFVDPGATTPPTSPPYPAGTVPYNLSQCASPTANANTSNFFYASDSTQIATQLNAMLLAAEAQGVRFVK
jgi:Flp pilus assembly protein TadG